jgi:CRP-like cAMP-binding protein
MQRTYQLSEIGPTRADGKLAALLAREGRRRRFAAGELIQQQGDEASGFWLIEAGTVNVCRFDRQGDVTVFAVLGAGDLFGELAHFAGVQRQVDAVAESATELVRIDSRLIQRLLATEPDFARWLLKSLANQLRAALDRIDSARRSSAGQRLIQTLIDMAKRDGPELDVTQQGLADLVGVSRVTVGQALGKLSKANLVRLKYGRILITDFSGLLAHLPNSR